jgi:hypothetical protein
MAALFQDVRIVGYGTDGRPRKELRGRCYRVEANLASNPSLICGFLRRSVAACDPTLDDVKQLGRHA